MTNRRLITYIILLVLTVLTMMGIRYALSQSDESQQRDYPEIKQEGVLRLVTDYTPVNYYLEGDRAIGFDYELIQLLGERSGLKVEVYPEVDLEQSFEGVASNQYDIVARQLPITTAGREEYSYTQPILLSKQVLVQLNDSAHPPIRNQLELAGKRVHYPSNPTTLQRIENLANEIGDTIYTQEEKRYGTEQLIMLVASGEIPYLVCDEQVARKMQQVYPQLDIATDISFDQFQSWALRSSSPQLLDSLNVWLEEIKATPAYQRLYHHYFE